MWEGLKRRKGTYRYTLQFLDILNAMSGSRRPEPIKFGLCLCLGKKPLLRCFLLLWLLCTTNHDFILFFFFEESRFVMNRARRHFHLQGVLFRSLFHLPQVLIVTVLRKPADHITVRPVYLQCMRVFVIDMVLNLPVSVWIVE